MSKTPNIEDLASDLCKIASLDLYSKDFVDNIELIKQYFIHKGLTLDDFNNNFGEAIEGFNYQKLSKQLEIIEDYIIDYQEPKKEPYQDPYEGLSDNDLL